MKKLSSNKKIIGVIAFNIGMILSGQVLSASDTEATNEKAEQVSQYINSADINRESQINTETVRNKAMKSKTQSNTIHSAIREHKRLSVNRNSGWLQTSSQTLNVSIPDTKNRAVWLSRANAKKGDDSLIVGLPNTGSSAQTSVTSDGSVVYVDDQHTTDVAVQSFDDSARILTVLNGVDSPTEYSYPVTLPVGGKIVKSDNGGVLVLNKKGSLIGGFATPWAVDSDGKQIPTHYDIRGNTIVQVVDHLSSNPHYPVVADPWLWIDLISSASWAPRTNDGYTLKVYPTTWAKSLAFALVNSPSAIYTVGLAGWNELYSKYNNIGRGIRINLTGMRDQYICHQQVVAIVAPWKTSWNLDEYRKSVGYLATVNAQCNPGGKNIFD